MKTYKTILFAALACLFISQTSCSTCYECQQEITVNGQQQLSDPETRCSADGSEIEALEQEGFICTQSV